MISERDEATGEVKYNGRWMPEEEAEEAEDRRGEMEFERRRDEK